MSFPPIAIYPAFFLVMKGSSTIPRHRVETGRHVAYFLSRFKSLSFISDPPLRPFVCLFVCEPKLDSYSYKGTTGTRPSSTQCWTGELWLIELLWDCCSRHLRSQHFIWKAGRAPCLCAERLSTSAFISLSGLTLLDPSIPVKEIGFVCGVFWG